MSVDGGCPELFTGYSRVQVVFLDGVTGCVRNYCQIIKISGESLHAEYKRESNRFVTNSLNRTHM